MNDIELRKWTRDYLANVVNEITDLGWGTETDDGYRLLLQKAGQLITQLRKMEKRNE